MAYTPYITKDGDRWDLIAYKAYGDANRMGDVIAANRAVGVAAELKPGITINIPILPPQSVDSAKLPPWKR